MMVQPYDAKDVKFPYDNQIDIFFKITEAKNPYPERQNAREECQWKNLFFTGGNGYFFTPY